jgi:adenylate cyclase
MSIRLKIVLIVVPLIIATLLLTGISSYFSASNGITRVAKDFMGFKSQELQNQAESQWGLLIDNNLTGKPEMVSATQAAVLGYGKTIIRSQTELILAVTEDGSVVAGTSAVAYQGGEQAALASLARARSTDLVTLSIGGVQRVAKAFWFDPFKWYMVVTEERSAFYAAVNQIALQTGIILVASILAGIILVLLFANYLTRPLTRVVNTMRDIISTNDLSKRVVVEYHDEIGQLAQTFNLMVENLSEAYRQIKGFAFKAVMAQRQEKRTQTLFGKFVPEHVINQYFANPEDTLVGDNRVLSVLFSDIRSFTTISESMRPDELVHSLNRYFDTMVAIIMKRDGIVDKYIGDAIKAFFGAQAKPEEKSFVLQSVLAAIEMIEDLGEFNAGQRSAGMQEFRIGVGVNYGMVTIGNIGTEKKKEYTVIGEMVELAEHFEGLTKIYHHPVIISESLHRSVKDEVACRLLDWIPRSDGGAMKIFTAQRSLSQREKTAWGEHNLGMDAYHERNFAGAAEHFREALKALPGDALAPLFLERCARLSKDPPPEGWNGVDLPEDS